MLLRSSSTPVLNSCLPHSKDSSPELEFLHQIPRTRSITLSASSSSLSPLGDSVNRMTRALSETDLRELSVPKRKPFNRVLCGLSVEDEEESMGAKGFGARSRMASPTLFSFSDCGVGMMDDAKVGVLVGGEIGCGGGRICSGGDSGWGHSDGEGSNRGNDSTDTDVYYQTMIEANPWNPLFLSNYARYLKEVRADYVKAEVYCGRAILANPNDGTVLSMYADVIWQSHKDASRAETYFDQAVKAAPDDCYVLASYAYFLWDAEVEDDVGEEYSYEKSSSFLHGAPAPPTPLTAAS